MSHATSTTLYRVDKFTVPLAAVAVFTERLRTIQQLLSGQPGVRQNLVLTQPAGLDATQMVTIVEWESEAAMAAAKAFTQRHYAEQGFNPAAFMQEHGIRPDFGVYQAL
ncbi:antibiotic biosynthesis monooxygenase [Chitinimonas sp.]|uniref:antibiotic biosynthesis monooxygenase n=1 Tax=Chitinimonas sp. TaxID=1934313 RepID=UPI002F946BB0